MREGDLENLLRFTLTQNGQQDEAAIAFYPGANPAYDAFDAANMPSAGIDVSSAAPNGQKLAINVLPSLNQLFTIPIPFKTGNGQATITFNGIESFANGTTVYLRDYFTGSIEVVTPGLVHNLVVNADPASQGTSRLALVFVPGAITGAKLPTGFRVSAYPNPAHGHVAVSIAGISAGLAYVQVIDNTGRVVSTLTAAQAAETIKMDITGLKAGLYQLRVQVGNQAHVEKLIIE